MLLLLGALQAWQLRGGERTPQSQRTDDEEISEWVHACRSAGGGRLVAAVIDTHLPAASRIEALKEVVQQYSSLGLPAKEDAYRLLSARDDVDRALRAGLSDNNPSLMRASLLALRTYEFGDHGDTVAQLIQRVLTNPTVSIQTVRLLAIQYLADFGQRRHESTLIDIIEMGQLADREAAIKGLTAFGTAKAVPGLQATAADPIMRTIRGQALAAVSAIQTRIGPLNPGMISLAEGGGTLSLAPRGGELSQYPKSASGSA
jgi:hypothetical protein